MPEQWGFNNNITGGSDDYDITYPISFSNFSVIMSFPYNSSKGDSYDFFGVIKGTETLQGCTVHFSQGSGMGIYFLVIGS
ncbi:gp53-like domain-containing protein [Megamonas hypermegale]|uniref:gp53-like domain-containing protein n=1 Tax=Megamonas hypermegale TaxID=158847 RepID=UPI003BEF3509